MTAILNFWQMSTSLDNVSGTIEKLDPENMGIAVGILLLCALELEICLGGQMTPRLAGKRRKKTVAGTRVKAEPSLLSCSVSDAACLFISVLLYRAELLCDRGFSCPICRSAHVNCGEMADWIRMPFGVVSGVCPGIHVLDGSPRASRGRGCFWHGLQHFSKYRLH